MVVKTTAFVSRASIRFLCLFLDADMNLLCTSHRFRFLLLSMLVICWGGRVATAQVADTLTFTAQSEGYALEGSLVKPRGFTEPMPAVVFLVGSGGSASYGTNYRKFVQWFLEEPLVPQGYVIVNFDKRGVGESEGVWYETNFEQRALDARNVALHLQQYDFIDASRIYVVGHSQGGWIVQIALAEYPEVFAGGISMAGATFGVRQQIINDYTTEYLCERGWPLAKAQKRATRKTNVALWYVGWAAQKGNMRQLQLIRDFTPASYLTEIDRPLLLLFGQNDGLVDPVWCQKSLDELFPGGLPAQLQTHIAIGENHSFKTAPRCFEGAWSDIYYSEATRDYLVSWLVGQK